MRKDGCLNFFLLYVSGLIAANQLNVILIALELLLNSFMTSQRCAHNEKGTNMICAGILQLQWSMRLWSS